MLTNMSLSPLAVENVTCNCQKKHGTLLIQEFSHELNRADKP
jgi:hypothetical protein